MAYSDFVHIIYLYMQLYYVCAVVVAITLCMHGRPSVLINFHMHMFPSCFNNVCWQMCDCIAMLQLWCIDMCFPCDLLNTLCLPLIIVCPLIPFSRPHSDTQFDTTFWSAVKQHCLH